MSRLLFCFFVILACRWIWRLSGEAKAANRKTQSAAHANTSGLPSEQMVRCAECGVYVPISQAQYVAKHLFRCREHTYTSAQRTAAHGAATQEPH